MDLIILNIFLISLLSFIIPFFWGKQIGSNGAVFLVVGNTFILYSFSIVLLSFFYLTESYVYEYTYNWLSIDLIDIQLGFSIDSTALVMFFLITFISLIAQIYSYEYLYTDPHLPRYYSFLGLFTFFMILLIFSADFIQLFFAWEGVGICSYLLINFWYFRCQASKASILAVLVNKIGDISFLIGICILYSIFFSTNIDFITKCSSYIYSLYELDSDIFVLVDKIYINEYLLSMFFISSSGINLAFLELGCFFFLVACFGKSAQFIFHIWLPEAMEGPTPVSSLLHAATMVTLGIFLVLRMSFLFAQMPSLLILMVLLGTMSVVSSSISATMQEDVKKSIAYSTSSQLGYMFIGCGLGDFLNVLFQLFLHAFFKALLFLLSGYLIYISASEQDSRESGDVGVSDANLQFIAALTFCGTVASIGISPTGASASKEFLLEFASCSSSNAHEYISISVLYIIDNIPFFCTLLSAFYSVIGYASSFDGDIEESRTSWNSSVLASDPPLLLLFPLVILATFSIFTGYFYSEFLSIDAPFFFTDSVHIVPEFNDFDSEQTDYFNHDFLILKPSFSNFEKDLHFFSQISKSIDSYLDTSNVFNYKNLSDELSPSVIKLRNYRWLKFIYLEIKPTESNYVWSELTQAVAGPFLPWVGYTIEKVNFLDLLNTYSIENEFGYCTPTHGNIRTKNVSYIGVRVDGDYTQPFWVFERKINLSLNVSSSGKTYTLKKEPFPEMSATRGTVYFTYCRPFVDTNRLDQFFFSERYYYLGNYSIEGYYNYWQRTKWNCTYGSWLTLLDNYTFSHSRAAYKYNYDYGVYKSGFSSELIFPIDISILEGSVSEYYDYITESMFLCTALFSVPLTIIFGFLFCDSFSDLNCDDEFDSFTDEFFVIDIFYNRSYLYFYIYNFLHYCYANILKIFDKGLLEYLFGFGIFIKIKSLFFKYFHLETGYLYHSSGFLIITLTFFIFIIF